MLTVTDLAVTVQHQMEDANGHVHGTNTRMKTESVNLVIAGHSI